MSLTLSREELRELTGTAQPKRMGAWLESRGWVFEPPARRGDVPKVDRAYYLARMSGTSPTTKPERRAGPMPTLRPMMARAKPWRERTGTVAPVSRERHDQRASRWCA